MHQRTSQVSSITGLRAIAVLSVVLFHIDPAWMPGGFVGVDCFFVISGFVVAHSVMNRPAEGWRSFVADFYRRRLARIYPALLAYVAAATILSTLFIPMVRPTLGFELFGASAALGISNFLLKNADGGGYFAAASDFNPFVHTWSLGVEEQYYLLFSLTVLPLLRTGKEHTRGKIMALAGITALASLAFCAVKTGQDPAYAFYLLPTRLWELALGLLLRMALDSPRITAWAARAQRVGAVIAWAALALLFRACATNSDTGFPWPGALLPCLATAALIGALWLWRDSRVSRLLASPLPKWFGLISYSLYLWHWGVVVFMRWTVGLDSLSLKLAALTASIALGAASYHGIERTLQRRGRVASLPLVAATVLIACGCIVAGEMKPTLSLSDASRAEVWDPYSGPPEARPCRAGLVETFVANTERTTFAVPCRKPHAHKLFVIGDSHAAAYRRMLWRVAETGAWDVRIEAHNGCGLINFRALQRSAECDGFIDQAIAEVRRSASPGDVIFLAALQAERHRNNWGIPERQIYPVAVDPAIASDNRARLGRLARLGLPVIVEDAKPLMKIAMFRCADWFNRQQAYCRADAVIDRAEMSRHLAVPHAALRAVTAELPQVTIWDGFGQFCDSKVCDGRDGPYPLFYDVDHLSAYANDMLTGPFLEALQRAQGPAGR